MTRKIDYSDLIGLPFKDGGTGHTGSNPGGYDCYSLAREIYMRNGITLPSVNISVVACRQASQNKIDHGFKTLCQRIKAPETPCLVQILSSNPDYANHLAVFIGGGRIIHVTMRSNVIIQRLSTIHPRKIEGFYKYVG